MKRENTTSGNGGGALQYGNFNNYYQFHSADDRIQMLPSNVWLPHEKERNKSCTEPYLVLDIGSNTGELTQKLWEYLIEHTNGRTVYILGIEMDNDLIIRAQKLNPRPHYIHFVCQDIMCKADSVDFDRIMCFLHKYNRKHFDVICGFSITMWIHLNFGDDGLKSFLKRMSNLCELFVLEPQPWKCYQSAQHRLLRTGRKFELFKELNWRSNVEEQIDNYCQQVLYLKKIYQTSKSSWKRSIYFYRNKNFQ